ncbi:MAG: type II toxin-antitoxin system HicB family antitoxin [Oscillospiraceae bacterium]|nr:type II toxin-antitoxin system HicB family antitoxin [Oscillospiraceae bacterium]
MKTCYPIILTEMDEGGYLVYVPDMQINTTGSDISNALEMAKDAIELCGVGYEDEKLPIPQPSELSAVKTKKGELLLAVNVDFEAYRRMLDNRSVKKNCTLPSWMNERAEKAGLNFSAALQRAIREELGIEGNAN